MSFGAGGEPIGFLRIGAHGVGGDLRRHHALAQPGQHAAFQSLAVHGAGVVAAVAKHMVGAVIAVRVGSAVRPQSAFVCLASPNRGRRQAVKAEAAKRGRDSVSLYGLRPVRFTAVSSKRAQTSSLRI